MPWKKNKRLIEQGFADLAYLPRERCGWDCSLASLAYGIRLAIERRPPDLPEWAARHGVAASERCTDLGPDALVLWHGTSALRAERIREHGLFSKGGLWTTTQPGIAHNFCRGRSERFGVEGAVVCIVLDRRETLEGVHYAPEGKGDILRFHRGLPAEVVEYVLVRDAIRFTGQRRAHRPAPWRSARFKRQSGEWAPVQAAPVRYDDSSTYSSPDDFARIGIERLLSELGEVSALEVFSTLYATVRPFEALEHEHVLELIDDACVPYRRHGKWQTFRARPAARAREA